MRERRAARGHRVRGHAAHRRAEVVVTVSDRGAGPLEQHLAQPRRRRSPPRTAAAWRCCPGSRRRGTRHEQDGTHPTWFSRRGGAADRAGARTPPSNPADPRGGRRTGPSGGRPLADAGPVGPARRPRPQVRRAAPAAPARGAPRRRRSWSPELVHRLCEVLDAEAMVVEVDEGDGAGHIVARSATPVRALRDRRGRRASRHRCAGPRSGHRRHGAAVPPTPRTSPSCAHRSGWPSSRPGCATWTSGAGLAGVPRRHQRAARPVPRRRADRGRGAAGRGAAARRVVRGAPARRRGRLRLAALTHADGAATRAAGALEPRGRRPSSCAGLAELLAGAAVPPVHPAHRRRRRSRSPRTGIRGHAVHRPRPLDAQHGPRTSR